MPELVCSADSPDWLLHRRTGVTATDITAIVGLSPYESAYSLFFKKRGDIPDEHADNDRMQLGRFLEPYILNRWVVRGRDQSVMTAESFMIESGLWRSTTRPWQLATPDGILARYTDNQPHAVVEVKSWADMDRDRWADGPPARVRAQVLWQMDALDVPAGHVGVLFLPSGEFRSYVIEHSEYPHDIPSPGFCHTCGDIKLLRSAAQDFMDRLDLNQPPSPDASSATLAALKARFADPLPGKEAEIDADLWQRYEDAKHDQAVFDEMVKGKEALIREQAGEAKHLTVNGVKVATRVISDQNVKAHTRHVDYIRRTTSKGETGE